MIDKLVLDSSKEKTKHDYRNDGKNIAYKIIREAKDTKL